MEPVLEGFGCEGRNSALRWHSCYSFCYVAEERKLRREIDKAWSSRRQACPKIYVAEGVGAERPQASFVVMRQEFCFVRRDVDCYGAIAFAPFAGKAEIKGLLDFLATPAVADDGVPAVRILRHFPEEVGAAPGAVFFFMCDAPAGAHHAAFFATALADSDTPQSGM